MIINTIDDLGHPLILETAKNLALKQVALGFCAPQDHQDLAQDLLLYLCRQFSRYTGSLPLITWACRRLHGRINTINRRLFGIPSPSQQRRPHPEQEARQSVQPVPEQEARQSLQPVPEQEARQSLQPVPNQGPAPAATTDFSLGQPVQNQAESNPTLPKEAQAQTVEAVLTASPHQEPDASTPENHSVGDTPPDVKVGSWWQRLLLLRAAMVSRWQRPPRNREKPNKAQPLDS